MRKKNIAFFSLRMLCFPFIAFSAEVKDIDVAEAKKNIENKKYDLILDVRTQEEYNGDLGHIQGSKLLPMQEIDRRMEELSSFKGKNILVYCAAGGRSSRASDILSKNGYSNVENMAGGMTEWNKRGYPVEKK
ncbi:MAG: rhodanese-like domain-containing protein [Nitrospinae bacterium]|nr:rhodanese-like domain-containing protein [Nitrospinota bacterium]